MSRIWDDIRREPALMITMLLGCIFTTAAYLQPHAHLHLAGAAIISLLLGPIIRQQYPPRISGRSERKQRAIAAADQAWHRTVRDTDGMCMRWSQQVMGKTKLATPIGDGQILMERRGIFRWETIDDRPVIRMTPERYVEHDMSGKVVAEWSHPEPGCKCDECTSLVAEQAAAAANREREAAERRARTECRECGAIGVANRDSYPLCSDCLHLEEVRVGNGHSPLGGVEETPWRRKRDGALSELKRLEET